jgi:hypothetical protein
MCDGSHMKKESTIKTMSVNSPETEGYDSGPPKSH